MRNRRPFHRRCHSPLAVCVGVCAAAFLAGPHAAAELLYHDPFAIGLNPGAGQYALGPIAGQNPTVGPEEIFAGPWQPTTVGEDGPNQHVVDRGLALPGRPPVGGAVAAVVDPLTDSAHGRIGRLLATPWDQSTEATFYLGYLADYGAVADPDTADPGDLGYRATEFWPVGSNVGDDAGRTQIGFNAFLGGTDSALPSTARLQLVTPDGGVHYLSDTPFNEFGGTHVIVMKFELAAAPAGDTISVFVDPLDALEPQLPNGLITGLDFTLGAMSTISYFGNPTGVLPVFDELRVGTTFSDMGPPIDPPPGPCAEADQACYLEIITNLNLTGLEIGAADIAGADGRPGTDGRIDLRDLNLWRRNRTDAVAVAASSSAPVPEPASWMGVAVAILVQFYRRRRARA